MDISEDRMSELKENVPENIQINRKECRWHTRKNMFLKREKLGWGNATLKIASENRGQVANWYEVMFKEMLNKHFLNGMHQTSRVVEFRNSTALSRENAKKFPTWHIIVSLGKS